MGIHHPQIGSAAGGVDKGGHFAAATSRICSRAKFTPRSGRSGNLIVYTGHRSTRRLSLVARGSGGVDAVQTG
jgi:hypothetical protein